jgi:hypothetical protein
MLTYDKPPITSGSFTRIRNFEACPYRVALESAEKREKPPVEPDSPLVRGIEVHQHCEDYVKGVVDEPDELISKPKVLEALDFHRENYRQGNSHIEEDWAVDTQWQKCGWWDKDVWIRNKIDAGTYLDKNHALYDDWKTGKMWGNEVKTYEQGGLGAIFWMMRNPEVTQVTSRFVYTDQNKIKKFEFKRKDMAPIIKRWTERMVRLTLGTEFPAKPNRGNCHYCPFGPNAQGNNSCPHGVEW